MTFNYCFRVLGILLIFLLPGALSAQEVSPQSDVEASAFQFNDPVASYNGHDISQQDFLNFLEVSANLSAEDFASASEETLMEYLYAYAIYHEFPQKMQEKEIYHEDEIQHGLVVLDNYTLATLYEQKVGELTAEELEERENSVENGLDLPLATLYLIAQKESLSQSEATFIEDSDLQEAMRKRYKHILLLAELSREAKIHETAEYKQAYDWAVRSYLSDQYVVNYLKERADADEMDTIFSNWLSEQDFFEYKASHIYFEDEILAQEVLLQLQNKTISFEEAVKLYSKDPASNEFQGKMGRGDWVEFPQKEHPIAKAVELLAVGTMSPEVVKGIEGYHIVRLEDKRESGGPVYIHDKGFKEEMWRYQKRKELFEQFQQENKISLY